MKKIKILETIRQGQIGGGESHVLELASNLDLKRFEPVVLSFTPGPMVDELKRRGIRVKVIYTEKAFDFRVWKDVRDFIDEEQIDIVHAHGTRANSNVFWAAKKLGLPLIYTVHGWSFHIDQKFHVRKIRELSEYFLTFKADKTICVSRSNQQDGIERFNMNRSTVIHNAVDLNKFNPDNRFKDVRKELGISADKIVIGYIVRMTVQKDPFTMLRAMKELVEKSKNIVLLMVGEGNLKTEAIKLSKSLGIQNNIIFQPFRTDIPDILNAIDIYCLPSLWEGFPIGILEAMAMKKAVVASPVDGTKELLDDGKTGLLVDHGKPEELADALFLLASDLELRRKLAENAFTYVQNNFGIQHLVYKIQQEYLQIAI